MSDLSKKYDKILLELKDKIKNPEEYQFVKDKVSELTIMFMDSIDKFIELQNNQEKIENKIKKIQKDIKHIQSDFYVEEDDECNNCNSECDDDECNNCNCGCDDDECDHNNCEYDNDKECEFEIICPYCDYEFIAGNTSKNTDVIECPKCHKMIELDWNDEECDCESCSSCCSDEKNESQVCKKTNNIEKVAEDSTNYDIDSKNESSKDLESSKSKDNILNSKKKNKNISNNKNEDDM